jgi:hypothetical protein
MLINQDLCNGALAQVQHSEITHGTLMHLLALSYNYNCHNSLYAVLYIYDLYSFHRLLVHRLAIRFKLDHQVLESLPSAFVNSFTGMSVSGQAGGTYTNDTTPKNRCVYCCRSIYHLVHSGLSLLNLSCTAQAAFTCALAETRCHSWRTYCSYTTALEA